MTKHFISFIKGHLRQKNTFLFESNQQDKLIIFVHGLCADTLLFETMKKSFTHYDFAFFNYNSKKYTLNELSDFLAETINHINYKYKEIIIISHSMGGIISLLTKNKTNKINKIICIATPINGSYSARVVTNIIPKKLTGISIHDLNHKIDNLPLPDLIIYSELNKFNRNILQNKPGDGIVFSHEIIPENNSTSYAKIDNVGHTAILWHPETINVVKKYLESGS